MSDNAQLKVNMVATVIVLLSVIYQSFVTIVTPRSSNVSKFVVGAALTAVAWLCIHRDTYLPFLGPAAFPSTLVKNAFVPEKANVEITLDFPSVPNGTKIAYWGAKPATSTQPSPSAAYSDFSNAGVTSVESGKATFKFHCPSKYTIPWGKTLNRHIHYRVCRANGMLEPVKTAFVNC